MSHPRMASAAPTGCTSLLDVVSRHLGLSDCLDLAEACRLQAAHRRCREELQGAWPGLLRRALPRFELPPELLRPGLRPRLLAALPPLLQAEVAEGQNVKLQTLEQAERLARLLSSARESTAAHAARGGTMAHTLLAHLRFPHEGLGPALEKQLLAKPLVEEQEASLCLGEPIACKTLTNGAALHVHVAVQGGSLLMGMRDDDTPSDEIVQFDPFMWNTEVAEGGPVLTLDIASLSPALVVHYRGVGVQVNGTWESTFSGILSVKEGLSDAAHALTEGVLCILSVRDGVPQPSRRLIDSLNVDSVR